MPTVGRLPLEPIVNYPSRGTDESGLPDLLRFSGTPGDPDSSAEAEGQFFYLLPKFLVLSQIASRS